MKEIEDNHKLNWELIIGNHVNNIPKLGIIHIGAHQGQEVENYLEMGFEKIILIEANPKWYKFLIEKFKNNPKVKVFGVAISNTSGLMDFHIHTSKNGSTEPASLLQMKEFNKIVKSLHTPATIQVPVMTLDDFFIEHGLSFLNYNFINIDVQGAELMVLMGAKKVLNSIDVIVCEVNLIELYENSALEREIIIFLQKCQFVKSNAIYHNLFDENGVFPAWGECLFIKNTNNSSIIS